MAVNQPVTDEEIENPEIDEDFDENYAEDGDEDFEFISFGEATKKSSKLAGEDLVPFIDQQLVVYEILEDDGKEKMSVSVRRFDPDQGKQGRPIGPRFEIRLPKRVHKSTRNGLRNRPYFVPTVVRTDRGVSFKD